MIKITHQLFDRLCVKHLEWKGESLICSKCGKIAGIRYVYDDELKVITFGSFKNAKSAIDHMPDTHRYEDIDDSWKITFYDFDEFIHSIGADL